MPNAPASRNSSGLGKSCAPEGLYGGCIGFRDYSLGFWRLGFKVILGFRVLGLRALGFKVYGF